MRKQKIKTLKTHTSRAHYVLKNIKLEEPTPCKTSEFIERKNNRLDNKQANQGFNK